ncbi:MAG: hypothetical protein IKU86_06160 [Thermoguttaceae bacterium]|nr:hypothetical protein [Thermoguttaceae bacterium]
MRNGVEKAAAIGGICVVAAALWGTGYWQGGRSARSLTDNATAQTAQETEGAKESSVVRVARDLPIAENDAIPALDGRCEARLETSATEIPLGDAVYCRFVERNVAEDGTSATFWDYCDPWFAENGESSCFLYLTLDKIALESPKIDGKYIFAPEIEGPYGGLMGRPPKIALYPGGEYEYGTLAVEFPPLEDWNEQFWRGVRELLATEERVELRMRVAFSRRLGLGDEAQANGIALENDKTEWEKAAGVFERKIVLTRRPEAETKRFDEWFASTPDSLWPERKTGLRSGGEGEEAFKVPPRFAVRFGEESDEVWGRRLRASGRSDVRLENFAPAFDVWNFARFGNRKPSDPNNPTTLDGWRELEAAFSPSTVRDEITLTRLQLEYYNAENGEEADAALDRLIAWLNALDSTQRAAYKNAILAKAWMLNPRFGGGMAEEASYTRAETRGGRILPTNKIPAEVEIARKWVRLSEALGERSRKNVTKINNMMISYI